LCVFRGLRDEEDGEEENNKEEVSKEHVTYSKEHYAKGMVFFVVCSLLYEE